MTHTGTEPVWSDHRLLTTVASRIDGTTAFAVEGSIFVAGAAVQWLRDRLGVIDSAAATEAAARRTGGDTGGVHLVPAFAGLGAPWWDAEARGVLCGLTLDTGIDEIVTATLQSVAFQTRDLVDAMAADGAPTRGAAGRWRHGRQRLGSASAWPMCCRCPSSARR
ncbi:MAG: FGGY-family carbohydrate kinase [Gammaproteobacteria bacterium]|nr:FGGY-family carbohydrate kinase [Gammaproteobacteria bacterium]